MRIERTFDEQVVKSVMLHPAIWATVAEDDQIPGDWEPETDGECWLEVVNGDTLVGLYNFHPTNSTTLEIHAHVLPQYRKDCAFESGDLALKWMLEQAPEQYQKVIAQVPTLYGNVIKFTLAHGFTLEGINRLSDRIGGVLYDQYLLGITRNEIQEYLRAK